MTNSYSNSQILSAEETSTEVATASPDPFLFKDAINFELIANYNTSAPYYYDKTRNSWIFYIPGTELPGPPVDPAEGNIWIDPTNGYLMYVYNAGELVTEDNPDISNDAWVALTTNKRAYDYLIVPQGEKDSEVNFAPLKVDLFKQTFMYFNTQDLDLKVKVGDSWQSIKQSGIDAVEDPDQIINDAVPATPLRNLEESVESLQQRVIDLADQIGAPLSLPTNYTPETGPFDVNGYYPLYNTKTASDSAGDGTSHTHIIGYVTYYMPNGLEMNVTQFHGNYGTTGSTDIGSSGGSSSGGSNGSGYSY